MIKYYKIKVLAQNINFFRYDISCVSMHVFWQQISSHFTGLSHQNADNKVRYIYYQVSLSAMISNYFRGADDVIQTDRWSLCQFDY